MLGEILPHQNFGVFPGHLCARLLSRNDVGVIDEFVEGSPECAVEYESRYPNLLIVQLDDRITFPIYVRRHWRSGEERIRVVYRDMQIIRQHVHVWLHDEDPIDFRQQDRDRIYIETAYRFSQFDGLLSRDGALFLDPFDALT